MENSWIEREVEEEERKTKGVSLSICTKWSWEKKGWANGQEWQSHCKSRIKRRKGITGGEEREREIEVRESLACFPLLFSSLVSPHRHGCLRFAAVREG